jgi:hypothetical protein
MPRAAAEIEPVSRMLSSSLALPGPIRPPESKNDANPHPRHAALCHARGFTANYFGSCQRTAFLRVIVSLHQCGSLSLPS